MGCNCVLEIQLPVQVVMLHSLAIIGVFLQKRRLEYVIRMVMSHSIVRKNPETVSAKASCYYQTALQQPKAEV